MSLAWIRAVFVVSGRPFARALVAPTMAWMVPAAILFGGNGMTASGAVMLLRTTPATWVFLLLGFSALTAPAVRVALHARGLSTLRVLAKGRPLAPLYVILLLAQLPLLFLFAKAGAWGSGLATVAAALALQLSFVKLGELVGSLLPRKAPKARGPLLALCAHYIRTLWRREQASLSVSATVLGLGAGAMWLSSENDPPRDPLGRALCVLPVPVCVAAGLLARALVREEDALRGLLRSTRTRAWVPLVAMLVLVSTPNAAYAGTSTLGATLHAPARSAGADVLAGVAMLLLAVAVTLWARRHARTKKRDPAAFVAGTIGLALVAVIVGALW